MPLGWKWPTVALLPGRGPPAAFQADPEMAMATTTWWRGRCRLAIRRGDVGVAAKGLASHSGPTNLDYMAGALPKRHSDGEAGGLAGVIAPRWSYVLWWQRLGCPATPLEGGRLGHNFLTWRGATTGGARGISLVRRLSSVVRWATLSSGTTTAPVLLLLRQKHKCVWGCGRHNGLKQNGRRGALNGGRGDDLLL
jgi:hypothetical protein